MNNINPYTASSISHSAAAGRISFILGICGPCSAYNAACASSLVALHAAVRCLRAGDCDMALVIGVKSNLLPIWFEALAIARMSSPTGRCHTFDECADGMVRGEGCGAIILQRVSDAISSSQKMYGIVQSANVAQDGISASLTAPNGKSQEKLLISSLQEAGISGEDVDYIEAHGTGTSLGDPIEIGALISAIGERNKNHPVVVGSVKANIGHLEAASGIAG
jgi:acyl transferase domain-containing protein